MRLGESGNKGGSQQRRKRANNLGLGRPQKGPNANSFSLMKELELSKKRKKTRPLPFWRKTAAGAALAWGKGGWNSRKSRVACPAGKVLGKVRRRKSL